MKKLALMVAAAIALPAGANAAPFLNGSFENASVNPGASFATLSAGSTAITGWTVGNGSIDYIGGYWTAGDGSRSIDLSGNSSGSISQTFDTIAGQMYVVDFLISGNPAGPPPTKMLQVSATGTAASIFNYVAGPNNLPSISWSSASYSFVASGTSTTLTFGTTGSDTAYGPALDKVSVAAVPEPASWALMIGGFGIVGAFMRRRATRSAVAFG